jgi:AraC-like DNA-binding protein
VTGSSDVLTEILGELRVAGSRYCCSELGHPWGIEFSGRGTCYFHVVDSGGCWLRIDGQPPSWLGEGDLVVLPHGQGHALSDPVTRVPLRVDFDRHPNAWRGQGPVRWGEGLPRTRLVCGEFWLEANAHPVLEQLPLVLLVHGRSDDAPSWLRSTLDLLAAEARSGMPMVEVVITRLVDFLFLQTVRACVAEEAPAWLGALRDPRIAETIALMREQPSRDWTVEELARRVGMSRSVFSARFRELVGEPPLAHLTRWRIQAAAARLRGQPDRGLAEIAAEVGYASEAAFNRAFKRCVGVAPGEFRKGLLAGIPPRSGAERLVHA